MVPKWFPHYFPPRSSQLWYLHQTLAVVVNTDMVANTDDGPNCHNKMPKQSADKGTNWPHSNVNNVQFSPPNWAAIHGTDYMHSYLQMLKILRNYCPPLAVQNLQYKLFYSSDCCCSPPLRNNALSIENTGCFGTCYDSRVNIDPNRYCPVRLPVNKCCQIPAFDGTPSRDVLRSFATFVQIFGGCLVAMNTSMGMWNCADCMVNPPVSNSYGKM